MLMTGVSLFQATVTGVEIPQLLSKKLRTLVLRTNASAYFMLVATGDALKNATNFKAGLKSVNEYLKARFKVELLKQKDYSDFFNVVALSRNAEAKERIREAVGNFGMRLREEIDLTDTLAATCEITGRQIFRFQDAIAELDFDVGLRKAISKNRDLIVFIVSVIALGFTVYGQLAPVISKYINSMTSTTSGNAMVVFWVVGALGVYSLF
jgi:hypothetical protein